MSNPTVDWKAAAKEWEDLSDEKKKEVRKDLDCLPKPGWGSFAALGLPHDFRLIATGGASTGHGVENVAAKAAVVGYGGFRLVRWLFF